MRRSPPPAALTPDSTATKPASASSTISKSSVCSNASKTTPSTSANVRAAKPSSSRSSLSSGSSKPSRSPKRPLPLSTKSASKSSPKTGSRPGTSGCTTSATGASRVSSGGDIGSPPGTATPVAIPSSPAPIPPSVRNAPARCVRIRTCSTPGSAPASGPSQRSAGPIRPTTSNISIPRPSSSPASTSYSSGSRAWPCSASSSWATSRFARSTFTASCAMPRSRRCRRPKATSSIRSS